MERTVRRRSQKESLYIALGIADGDPGYAFVTQAMVSLGNISFLGEGLFRLETSMPIGEVFAAINERMIDPRMDSTAGLVVVDPKASNAKWYLSLEASALLNRCWRKQNNLFVCAKGCSPEMLGSAVRIGASIWYASSRYAPAQALEMLSAKAKNPITIFDAVGGVASSEPRLVDRPPVARSWQERTLAEFLHA